MSTRTKNAPVTAGRPPKERSAPEPVQWSPECVLLVAVVAVPPLLIWPGIVEPFMLVKATLIVLLATALAGVAIYRAVATRAVRLPISRALLPFAALGVALVLSTVLSSDLALSVVGGHGRYEGLVSYAAYLTVFLALVTAGISILRLLALALLVTTGVVTAYGLLQFVGAEPFTWITDLPPVFSTFGNVNFASGFVGVVLPLAAWVALAGENMLWRIYAAVLFFAGLLYSGLTVSVQGPLAGLAGSVLVFLVWALDQRDDLRRRLSVPRARAVAGMAGLGVLVLAAVLAPLALREIGDVGLTQRRQFWQTALAIFRDNALTGTGLATYGDYFLRYRPVASALLYGGERADSPHSVPLGMLANGGLLLGLTYAAVVLTVGFLLVRGLVRLGDQQRLMLAGFGGAWLAYQVQSFVSIDVPPLTLLHYVTAGAVLALAAPPSYKVLRLGGAADKRRGRKRRPSGDGTRAATAAVLVVVFIGLASVVTRPLRADIAAASGVNTANTSGAAGLEALSRATELAGYEGVYHVLKARLLAALGQQQQAAAAAAEGALVDEGKAEYAQYAAQLFTAAGDQDAATTWVREAARRDPKNPDVLVAAAQQLLAAGGRREAAVLLRRAFAIEPSGATGLPLAQLLTSAGDETAAEQTLETILALEPDNATAAQMLAELRN